MYVRQYGWYKLLHTTDGAGKWWSPWPEGPKPYKDGLRDFTKLASAEMEVQISLGIFPATFQILPRLANYTWKARFNSRYARDAHELLELIDTAITSATIADSAQIWVKK